jgi:F-box and WD-40 domain protein CDC4
MKWFAMRVGNQRVIITEDGAVDPESSPDAGWRRTLPTLEASGAVADHRIGLIEAMDRLKGKKVRKRSHDNDGDILHTNQLTPAASRNDHGYEVDAYPSPPRKRIRRPEEIATPIGGSGAPLSPLPSPEPEGPAPLSPASPTDEPSTLRSPAMGTGHEFAALYSLPSIVSQFDGFPDKLQQHVLMHLLRRSRIPTIQRVAGFANGALRRDFISSLPRELAVQILQSVDAKTLAQATRVSRKWRSVIDSERVVWKQRLIDEGLYQGHGREEEDEATIARRLKLLRDHKRSGSLAGHEDTESDESMANIPSMSDDESPVPLKHVYRRRYQSNENWFTKRPAHNSFPGHGTNVVTCLQFDRDKIVSASDDHSINVYSTVDGKLRKKLVGHDGGVWALQYRGHALVTGSTDRSLRVWDLDTLRLTHVFAGHTSTVRCLQIVEPVLDPKTGAYYPPYPVIVTGSRDHTLRVWKLPRKGQPNFTYHVSYPCPRAVRHC